MKDIPAGHPHPAPHTLNEGPPPCPIPYALTPTHTLDTSQHHSTRALTCPDMLCAACMHACGAGAGREGGAITSHSMQQTSPSCPAPPLPRRGILQCCLKLLSPAPPHALQGHPSVLPQAVQPCLPKEGGPGEGLGSRLRS